MADPIKTEHVAIRNANIGTKDKKGTPKIVIKIGQTLKLNEAQVKGYRINKIIA